MNNFPSIPMTTEETIEFNKWLEEHDEQVKIKAVQRCIDVANEHKYCFAYQVIKYLEELLEQL